MARIFAKPLHDEFAWTVGYIPYGGADIGEIYAVANAVGDGDDTAFYDSWVSAADRIMHEAADAAGKGRRASARDGFLRASAFYTASYHPLYGAPVDPRLLWAFRRQTEALNQGLALFDHPVVPMRIPFERTDMPAYLIPARGRERETRPLIIFNNGYDGTMTDMYFASVVAATQRGYHCLVFDGPGQGGMLYEHNVPLRPDWECVIKAVVDFAVEQSIVDPEKIALSGWSLGGYLAPRGASGEHRIAALIADPGTWGIGDGFRQFLAKTMKIPLADDQSMGDLDDDVFDRINAVIDRDEGLHWKIVKRGFWVHGVGNTREYLRSAEQFTMAGRAGLIRCPTLLTMAENDTLGAAAPQFYEALQCPRTLLKFAASEGAGEHCEMKNRSLINRRSLDWLDEVFGR